MADAVTLEYENQDAAPEALRSLLVKDETSGKLIAKLAPASKVDEFRSTNIARAKRIEELEAKAKDFEGLDPAKARAALAEVEKLRGQPNGNGNGHAPAPDDEQLKKLIQASTADLRTELATEKAARVAAEQARAEEAFSAQVSAAASTTPQFQGVALADALERARRVFVNQDGKWIIKEGDSVRRRNDGEAFTIADWFATDLRKNAPHFYSAGVNGGGAAGGAGGAGGAKSITRAAFNALAPKDQMAKVKGGFQITD